MPTRVMRIISTSFLLPALFFLFSIRLLPVFATSQTQNRYISVFVREGCVHCARAEAFFEDLAATDPSVVIRYYHLENPPDRAVWDTLTTRHSIAKVTPIIVVGQQYVVGFDQPETTGEELRRLIESDEAIVPPDMGADFKEANVQFSTCEGDGNSIEPCEVEETVRLSLPFVGSISTDAYPLIVLALMLGFFDGFNPCAMWVLVTFLVILLQVGDRRKMFAFAGIFILAEAIMYSLILGVWFTAWDFVKLDQIVTPIVGVVSVGGGVFFIREWRKKDLACKVTNPQERARTRERIRQLATSKFTFVTFLGILAVAFSVNIIEFACSIGIPQAFTKILEINALSGAETAFYIGVYILFYMIDDLFVFGLALWGADRLSLTTKYSKWSNLVGGIVMIILGILLLFYPSALRF